METATTEIVFTEPVAAPLARRLARAASRCAYVQKDRDNAAQGYRYASAAAVLQKINEALAAEEIATTVRVELLSAAPTPSGKQTVVTVKVYVTYHGPDGDRLTTEGLGSGADSGDKAVMKAQTAAIKYAHLLAFNVSTGDDPEADEETDRAASGKARAPASKRPEPADATSASTRDDHFLAPLAVDASSPEKKSKRVAELATLFDAATTRAEIDTLARDASGLALAKDSPERKSLAERMNAAIKRVGG